MRIIWWLAAGLILVAFEVWRWKNPTKVGCHHQQILALVKNHLRQNFPEKIITLQNIKEISAKDDHQQCQAETLITGKYWQIEYHYSVQYFRGRKKSIHFQPIQIKEIH